MSVTKFDIYFSGVVLDGFDPEQVRDNVGHLFKASDSMLNKLFSGSPIRIKAAVDQDTAIKYKLSFRKAGASIEIRSIREKQTIPEKPKATVVKPQPNIFMSRDEQEKVGEANLAYERGCLEMDIPDVDFILSPVGVILDDAIPQADEPISTTTFLELSPANTGSLEDCQVQEDAQQLPDINHLELV